MDGSHGMGQKVSSRANNATSLEYLLLLTALPTVFLENLETSITVIEFLA